MLSTGTHNTTTTLITLGPHYTTTTGIVDYTVGPLVERFKANLTILLMNETKLCIEICKYMGMNVQPLILVHVLFFPKSYFQCAEV